MTITITIIRFGNARVDGDGHLKERPEWPGPPRDFFLFAKFNSLACEDRTMNLQVSAQTKRNTGSRVGQ